MRRARLTLLFALVVLAAILAGGYALTRHGFSARDEPSGLEKFVARQTRRLAMPRERRALKNPLPATPEGLADARAHFADHCASCHGNDGRGETEIGRNLYPKAPNMAAADTQGLSDGELFSIIKNGIRLTGMPAWGADTPQDDRASWQLVHLIRRFPKITEPEIREMEALNPVSPAELRERSEEERFLEEGGEEPSSSHEMHDHQP